MRRGSITLALWIAACQSAPSDGALCHRASDCASPLICARGRCRAGCVTSDDCGALSRCLVDPTSGVASCSLDVDSCRDHDCPVGFLCRDDQCLNACGTIVSCPDGTCMDGACVTVHGGDASVPNDAAISSDAAVDPSAIVALGHGGTHFCAITGAGELWCWGASASLELGDRVIAHGDCMACSSTPVRALDAAGHPLTNVSAMVGEYGYTCAIVAGEVLCWGAGPLGTLATAATDPQVVLALTGSTVAPLTGATALVGGVEHVCALVSGEAWCWGVDLDGRLGDGGTMDSPRAIRASAFPSTLRAITASQHHTQVLTSDGMIVGAGNDDALELGDASGAHVVVPFTAAVPPAHAVLTGGGNTCAMFDDGTLGCWGEMDTYLADAPMILSCPIGQCTIAPITMMIPNGETAAGLAMSDTALCVWTDMGNVYCIGDLAVATLSRALTQVVGLSDVVEVVGGVVSMCARTRAGEVWCWGSNADGQLGRGTHDDGTFPVPMRVTFPL